MQTTSTHIEEESVVNRTETIDPPIDSAAHSHPESDAFGVRGHHPAWSWLMRLTLILVPIIAGGLLGWGGYMTIGVANTKEALTEHIAKDSDHEKSAAINDMILRADLLKEIDSIHQRIDDRFHIFDQILSESNPKDLKDRIVAMALKQDQMYNSLTGMSGDIKVIVDQSKSYSARLDKLETLEKRN